MQPNEMQYPQMGDQIPGFGGQEVQMDPAVDGTPIKPLSFPPLERQISELILVRSQPRKRPQNR